MKTALVCGAGGFIGGHLVKKLKQKNYWVRGVDIKHHMFKKSFADEFIKSDLRSPKQVDDILDRPFDEVYQLAADMGGAGFIFSGENDADIMHNSASINLNIVHSCVKAGVKKIFYSSSACIYPKRNQQDPRNPNCEENSAYPAEPDSDYGWEKLFSERFYLASSRNYDIDVRIARFHNIFGPEGSWNDGREKAPAAICRKVAMANDGDEIEIWGNGKQTRSFLYIDECIKGILLLMNSKFQGPVNIGSEEMITIDDLAKLAITISGKNLSIKHIDGPTGVLGRNSDNKMIKEKLGWSPNIPLKTGMKLTYKWISDQVEANFINYKDQ
tara:strand:- start:203 stop:1186 length:984 start_codon:yes stop_codon:yes gene_type:complete